VRTFIRTFDALVRSLQGVFEFSGDPACVFRLRRTNLRRPLRLDGVGFPAGTPVLELHLSNERIPPLPSSGPDLRWAALAAQRLRFSLGQVAAFAVHHDGAPGGLVGGTTILIDGPASEQLLRRLGFVPRIRPPGRPGERWRIRYALALMAVFNPPSRRRRSARFLRRTEVWMSMNEFLRRYAITPGPLPTKQEESAG